MQPPGYHLSAGLGLFDCDIETSNRIAVFDPGLVIWSGVICELASARLATLILLPLLWSRFEGMARV